MVEYLMHDKKDTVGVVVVDIEEGQKASKLLDRLTPIARENGIASCTIRNSQHFGALSLQGST